VAASALGNGQTFAFSSEHVLSFSGVVAIPFSIAQRHKQDAKSLSIFPWLLPERATLKGWTIGT